MPCPDVITAVDVLWVPDVTVVSAVAGIFSVLTFSLLLTAYLLMTFPSVWRPCYCCLPPMFQFVSCAAVDLAGTSPVWIVGMSCCASSSSSSVPTADAGLGRSRCWKEDFEGAGRTQPADRHSDQLTTQTVQFVATYDLLAGSKNSSMGMLAHGRYVQHLAL